MVGDQFDGDFVVLADFTWNDFLEMGQCFIDSGMVPLNHFSAFFAVGFRNRLFNLCNRQVGFHDITEFKEAGLHDGVDAFPHTRFTRNEIGIDTVYPDITHQDNFLNMGRQFIPNLLGVTWTV